MFFDGFGTRRFAGGITLSRGHEGPSAGCDRLAELLSGKLRKTIELPAFGCRLCLPEAERETNPPKSAARWVRSESFL